VIAGERRLRIVLVVAMLIAWRSASPLYAQDGQDAGAIVEPVASPPSGILEQASRAAGAFRLDQVIQQPAGPPPTPRHTGIKALLKDLVGDVSHLPSKENLFWVGVGGGLALAAHPFDDNVNEAMVGSTFAKNFFKPGSVVGQFGTLFGSAGIVYGVGRIKDQPKVSHLGMDLIEALVVSEGLVQGLKYATQRERPDHSSKHSFPSGHASDTFAFATALERHLGWKGAVPAYIISSYVAMSRLPANRHWLSDVVFGSSVGIIAGRTVTRHGRKYPFEVRAVPGGAAIVYVRQDQRSVAQ
jgi:membrane-associated phospholipid phosphatase